METDNIFSEFTKPSKEDWKDKIKGELGEKYDQIVLENYGTNPSQHFDDKITIKTNERPNKSTFFCEEINVKNNFQINQTILTALEGGANSIKLSVQYQWSFEDFQEIFKGVFLAYIFVILKFESDEINLELFFQNFKKYLLEKEVKFSEINGQITPTINTDNSSILKEFSGLKLTTIISSENVEPIIQLLDILLFTENKLSYFENINVRKEYANSLVFDLKLSNHFYHNIALIKTLKILLRNVLKAYELSNNIFIKVNINTNTISDKSLAIIAATNQALSAKIGGIDLLEMTNFDLNQTVFSSPFSNRMARNIQNILELESGFNKVIDPSSGSYFIDNLTKNICEKVWAEFQKNQII